MVRISASYIDEPDLVFGHRGIEKDPKLGLKHFGPYIPLIIIYLLLKILN